MPSTGGYGYKSGFNSNAAMSSYHANRNRAAAENPAKNVQPTSRYQITERLTNKSGGTTTTISRSQH
jgi:hypothetical protein